MTSPQPTSICRSRSGARTLPLLALLLAAAPATAQVDLPTPRGKGQEGQPAQAPRGREKDRRGLDLPTALPPATGRPTRAEPASAPDRAPPPPPVELGQAAAFVLEQLEDVTDPRDRLVDQAVQSLTVMGPQGVQAARMAVRSDSAAVLLAAARTLLVVGGPEDRDLVLVRLQERLPREACAPLLEAIVQLYPERPPLSYVCRLLEHQQAPVRQAASKYLGTKLEDPTLLAELAPRLESKQTDTRLRAVQLVEEIGDSRALGVLLDVLGDRSARVSYRAARALAESDDERVDAALVNRAFGRAWILRENAYAILALVEREDEFVRPILDGAQADPLLQGLDSSDPFISGTCAAALAGIGFRSTDLAGTEWLDDKVAHALVRAVSGRVFHNDFTSLQGAAIRRLTLISGEGFGSDGPAWVEWWSRESRWFTAHRASIPVDPQRVGTLRVEVARTGMGERESFALLGPDAIWQGGEGSLRVDETVFVTRGEAADMLAVLQREGVLGAERLPGRRGPDGPGARSLVVVLDGRSKAFRLAAGLREDWFDTVTAAADSLRDRNRWQRYFVPGQHESALELWMDEAGWWESQEDPAVRDRRLMERVLTWLAVRPTRDRDGGIDELLRLDAAGATRPQDFSAVLDLLRDEVRAGPRSRKLVRLGLAAARTAAGTVDGEVVTIPAELADDLLRTHVEVLGAEDTESIAAVLAAAGPAFAREVARRPQAELRRAAAKLLGEDPEPADVEVLMTLLQDPDPGVELAAVEALGAGGVEGAREELLLRARIAPTRVRAAALTAVGTLGGEEVLDALVIGMTDPDPLVQAAAANGLAELADPRSAPFLTSLLGQTRADRVREPVRRALLAMGDTAQPELLRAVHGSSRTARREAALILAYQGVPQAASTLISLLTEDPEDGEVAAELAVLSGVDMRTEPDPAGAWWQWWDLVVHDDSIAWLCAGLERSGVASPVPDAFRGKGTREGARFLVSVVGGEFRVAPHLVERARRELERLLGHPVTVPAGVDRGAAMGAWIDEVEERWS